MIVAKHRTRRGSNSTRASLSRTSPALLGCLAFVLLIVSLSASMVSTLLPYMLSAYALPLPTQERHAAFLNGSYLLAMFVAGPALGYLSDRIDRRTVLLAGLALYVVSLFALSAASFLGALYVSRILSGLGAGALLPVMLAHVSEQSAEARRVRRFAWLVSAVMLGGIAGPFLGGLAAQSQAWDWTGLSPTRPLMVPMLAAAFASGLAWCAIYVIIPAHRRDWLRGTRVPLGDRAYRPAALYALFALSIAVMYAIGAFEVGLATLSRQKLQLDATELGRMYTTCALVMLVMQALFFAEPFKDFANRHLLVPAFVVTALGLALFPLADTVDGLAWVVSAVAGGAGLIAPVLSYRVSLLADGQQGKSFGLQSASSNLGQALGSAGSGILLGPAPQLPYWLAAALLVAAAAWILFRMQPPQSLFNGERRTSLD
ncbi:MFS transporter [Herbaspirillum sp. HC18]|nr:MFS transporter [Herbaspirillum sp. HC18]